MRIQNCANFCDITFNHSLLRGNSLRLDFSLSGVNLTNILSADFAQIFLHQKCTNLNFKIKKAACVTFTPKAACKMLVQLTPGVSISSTFYQQFIIQKFYVHDFLYLKFGFILFGTRKLVEKLLLKC
jgi:hypothetical protein